MDPVWPTARIASKGTDEFDNDSQSVPPHLPRRLLAAAGAVATAAALAACGSGSPDEPQVVATTGILADIAEQVAADDIAVEQLVPDGVSPHDFSLSAKARAAVEDAVLVVRNGAGLEAGMADGQAEAPSWELTENAGPLLTVSDGNAEDPHVWMDPSRVAEALPSLAAAMGEADPSHASAYAARAERFASELRRLDRELARALASLPPADRELVTSHDSLGYFASRYGFEVVATPFPSTGPEAEPSAEAIAAIDATVKRTGVPAVFAEPEDDPEVLEGIADRTGVRVV